MKFFKEVDQLKKLVNTTRDDIRVLCGDVKIRFALRKAPAIGNAVVRNGRLSDRPQIPEITSQKCGARGCLTDPQLFDSTDVVTVNGMLVKFDFKLSCKDNNIIYIAQCLICNKINKIIKNDTYLGQTVTPMHIRMNGHRSKFCIDSRSCLKSRHFQCIVS